MMKKTILFLVIAVLSTFAMQAQQDNREFEIWKQKKAAEYNAFKDNRDNDYAHFRKQLNEEYAQFMRQRWQPLELLEEEKSPDTIPPVPPDIHPEEDVVVEQEINPQPIKDFIEVDIPKPQPEPIVPIEIPLPDGPKQDSLALSYFGTDMMFAKGEKIEVALSDLSENDISHAWSRLSSGQCEVLLGQCLANRSRYKLNDWAYLQLLEKVSKENITNDPNGATLLMAWLFCQSGYKMRLAKSVLQQTTPNGRLYLMFGCNNVIYDTRYFIIDGVRYYPYSNCNEDIIELCPSQFPQEQSLSLNIRELPMLTVSNSDLRFLQSQRYPEMSVNVSINNNLIDYYGSYPKCALTDFMGSRWALYANTPLSEDVKHQLYPQLTQYLSGKEELAVVEELLNFVQTAFVYGYDDTVWGEDRAFFAEETLFYPFSDCEDRSILFSRLVRDLVGLDVLLLYYPGHLATAVKFNNSNPAGDYIALPEGNYFIADPTYRGAKVGESMPSVKSKEITVIRL